MPCFFGPIRDACLPNYYWSPEMPVCLTVLGPPRLFCLPIYSCSSREACLPNCSGPPKDACLPNCFCPPGMYAYLIVLGHPGKSVCLNILGTPGMPVYILHLQTYSCLFSKCIYLFAWFRIWRSVFSA